MRAFETCPSGDDDDGYQSDDEGDDDGGVREGAGKEQCD